MTTFQCPRHGAYAGREIRIEPFGSDGEPFMVLKARAECPQCVAAHRAAIEATRSSYEWDKHLWARWRASGVPRRYQNRTLGAWLPRDGQEPVKRMIEAWLRELPDRIAQGSGLMLMGAPGTGKTHLLAAICLASIEKGQVARYVSWPAVWAMFRPPQAEDRQTVFEQLASCPLLMLDEIGVGTPTEREQARLFELIDGRYSQQLPTVIATNCTMETLNRIGERTADQLREVCIPIVITGSSYREQAAGKHADAAPYPRPTRPEVVSVVAINGEDTEQRWRP